ncbi:hypothetical protein NEHOM01_1943 [Nematocida homosporus]|uniref:uncharacterized protein n=1 Tax=Nematocida homosporus TaxID=1912981 RepID=UPI00221F2FB1|nr:uncharacterized protein NEHOM01_1943 [Nematocida homosporus]KAI5187112.1 hypothetical protein NEHOM01_1943 [Nematocida homosporus]
MHKCVHCQTSISTLTEPSLANSKTTRSSLCMACKQVADPYIFNQLKFLQDLLLFKPEAFRHLVFNTSSPTPTTLFLIRLAVQLINTFTLLTQSQLLLPHTNPIVLSPDSPTQFPPSSFSPQSNSTLLLNHPQIYAHFLIQTTEPIFLFLLFAKVSTLRRITKIVILISTFCFLKLPIFISLSTYLFYAQMINLIVSLMTAKALSILLNTPYYNLLLAILFHRCLANLLLSNEFQI